MSHYRGRGDDGAVHKVCHTTEGGETMGPFIKYVTLQGKGRRWSWEPSAPHLPTRRWGARDEPASPKGLPLEGGRRSPEGGRRTPGGGQRPPKGGRRPPRSEPKAPPGVGPKEGAKGPSNGPPKGAEGPPEGAEDPPKMKYANWRVILYTKL